MSADALPSTLAGWERGLVDRFLRVGDCGDASPLRSFEITSETLATVFPDADATPEQSEAAFRGAVRTDPRVFDAFRAGTPRIAGTVRPECFAYLCASLLIDTLLDGAYSGQGQFRERLRTWLDTSRTMMQLPGIASMWHDLERWLEERVAVGEPFRTLVLPDPRTWTQIGHTRRLSFPTRSDVRFLDRTLANFPRGASDPPGLIRAIEAAIERDGASWGMESAFAEFRDAFRSGGASTGHRFWRLVLRATQSGTGADAAASVEVEIDFDEDGRPGFRVGGRPASTLASAMRAPSVARSANLGPALLRGIVFFRQAGMARWVAVAEPPPGLIRVGIGPALAAVARGTIAEFRASGEWLLTTEALRPGAVDDLLLRLRLSTLRRERLIDVSVEGGVHTGGGMLGRRRFLPHIVAGGRATAIRGVLQRGSEPPLARSLQGRIAADSDLDGHYELSVSSAAPGDAPEWTRRIRFRRDALPHSDTGGAAENDQLIREWVEVVDPAARWLAGQSPPPHMPKSWNDERSDIADLLEAVYAAGRSGLGDADLVDLVSRAGAPAPVWDVLRSIQESGFVAARKRARWRGRSWTLEPPGLAAIHGGTLVEGATCATLQEEFRQVAVAAGGVPFRTGGPAAWSPPVIGAAGVEPAAISEALGWPVRAGAQPEPGMGALERSDLMAIDHVHASSWDWARRRFVVGPVAPAEVSITRWAHPGGRDHDQYRVRWSGDLTCHSTRTAAILQGHAVAAVPLFVLHDGTLVRTAAEGALPVEIARRLLGVTLRTAEALGGGGYAYPADYDTLLAFDAVLPGCIAGLPMRRPTAAPHRNDAAARGRRDGGRTRPRWRDGGVRAA